MFLGGKNDPGIGKQECFYCKVQAGLSMVVAETGFQKASDSGVDLEKGH